MRSASAKAVQRPTGSEQCQNAPSSLCHRINYKYMPKKVDIDPDKVKMLASFGCTYLEIGKYFAVNEAVIRKKYRAEY